MHHTLNHRRQKRNQSAFCRPKGTATCAHTCSETCPYKKIMLTLIRHLRTCLLLLCLCVMDAPIAFRITPSTTPTRRKISVKFRTPKEKSTSKSVVVRSAKVNKVKGKLLFKPVAVANERAGADGQYSWHAAMAYDSLSQYVQSNRKHNTYTL